MAPTLYMILASPPVRAVLMTAKAVGIELDKKDINLFAGEHLKPDFLKMNPQHTVPVLEDNGFVVCDSHAINTYLVSKYGKDDSLYPKDLQKRTIVDQRLHFDSGTLFARGVVISRGLLLEGDKTIYPKNLTSLEDAYSVVEKLLANTKFIAGDQMTIADFSYITSITAWNAFVRYSEEKYPNIAAWIKRMEALPYYKEVNGLALEQFHSLIRDICPK